MILVTIKKLNDLRLTVLLPAEGIIRQPYSMSFQDLLHYIASAAMPPLRIRNVFRHRFYFRYGIFRTTRQATFTHYFYIGSCLAELGQYEEALNYFFKLDFIESNCVKAWRGIGWCSFISLKYEQAMKYYEKIIEHKPLAIDYMNAGHVAWVMGNIQKAAVLYGKAITACGTRERFLEMFHKDEEPLLKQGIREEDIPLMLDLL